MERPAQLGDHSVDHLFGAEGDDHWKLKAVGRLLFLLGLAVMVISPFVYVSSTRTQKPDPFPSDDQLRRDFTRNRAAFDELLALVIAGVPMPTQGEEAEAWRARCAALRAKIGVERAWQGNYAGEAWFEVADYFAGYFGGDSYGKGYAFMRREPRCLVEGLPTRPADLEAAFVPLSDGWYLYCTLWRD